MSESDFVQARTQRFPILAVLLTLSLCGHSFGMTRYTGHRSRKHSGKHHARFLRCNPLFRPSHQSLLRQNEEIDRLELPRIADDDELEALKASQPPVATCPGGQSRH